MLEDQPLPEFGQPKRPERASSGTAAQLLQEYAANLQRAHYGSTTLKQRVAAAAHLACWLESEGVELGRVDDVVLEHFDEHLGRCRCAGRRPGDHAHTRRDARRFIAHLRASGAVASSATVPNPVDALCDGFLHWIQHSRGIRERTATGYRSHVRAFLDALGTDPARYEVSAIRRFLLMHCTTHRVSYVKRVGSVVRMFLRFLTLRGLCPSALVEAVPKTANWTLADVPRHLSPESVDKVVAAADVDSRCSFRDRAVLLLLARLGLRAHDIVELHLSDLDWERARIRVLGKGRGEAWLPLPQDAGDALLAYLEKARPAVAAYDQVFLRVRAPIRPWKDSSSVCAIARQAIRRAGVERPDRGVAHLFRHSLAKRLLAANFPLQAIGVVLRHRSVETTAQYAKIDTPVLRSVAQPWPNAEGSRCWPKR